MTRPPSLPGGTRRPTSHRPLWVLIAVVALPILEIALLVLIGKWLGVLATIGLVLLVGVVGVVLVLREGPRTARSLGEALGLRARTDGNQTIRSAPHVPSRELSDGALVLLGALLLVLPGFISDVLAILCLLPATRGLPRWLIGRAVRRRADEAAARWQGRARGPVVGQIVVEPEGGSAAGNASGNSRPPRPGGDAAGGGRVIEGRIVDPPS